MPTLEERLRSRLTSVVKTVAEEVSTNTFSGYLVKRLIVKGSFKNVFHDDGRVRGFQIQVKNKLGVATIVGCTPVKIDGEVFSVDQIVVQKGSVQWRAAEISDTNPIGTSFGDEMLITIEDDQGLEAGDHQAVLGLNMAGLGVIMVSFDETLAGRGCEKRVRKAAPAADGEADFTDVMRRTVALASEHIGPKTIAENYKTVRGIVLDLSDIGARYGVRLSAEGTAEFVDGPLDGEKILTIRTTRTAFHNMAHNKLNPGIAYARGEIRVEGIPILKLRGMDSLLTSIFHGYRAASQGLEFEAAAAAGGAGVIEEILGMGLTVLDEALKALDKVLGVFGVKYFYEKTLNRMELVWDILDREMRRMLSFGGGVGDGAAPDVADKQAPETPAAPAAGVSLRDKLRSRIATVVESAVSEVARSAVSGYLVKRLVKPGSFRNFEEDGQAGGFEVTLKNKLGTATIIGFTDIRLDGEPYALDVITIHKDRKVIPAAEISQGKPLLVTFGDELLVRVARPGGIAAGTHRITMGVNMVGVGGVDVDYEEKLAGGEARS